MRRTVSVLFLVVAATVLVPTPPLFACGDKLLSIARNIRLQHAYKAHHPATILLYAGHAMEADKAGARSAITNMSILYSSLKRAGHKLFVADTPSEMDEALKDLRFDIIVAEVADMPSVQARVAAAHAKTMVLPVAYNASKAAFAALEQQYRFVLKTPATSLQHLEAIDRAMKPVSAAVATGH